MHYSTHGDGGSSLSVQPDEISARPVSPAPTGPRTAKADQDLADPAVFELVETKAGHVGRARRVQRLLVSCDRVLTRVRSTLSAGLRHEMSAHVGSVQS
jgi:hypothetical protein